LPLTASMLSPWFGPKAKKTEDEATVTLTFDCGNCERSSKKLVATLKAPDRQPRRVLGQVNIIDLSALHCSCLLGPSSSWCCRFCCYSIFLFFFLPLARRGWLPSAVGLLNIMKLAGLVFDLLRSNRAAVEDSLIDGYGGARSEKSTWNIGLLGRWI